MIDNDPNWTEHTTKVKEESMIKRGKKLCSPTSKQCMHKYAVVQKDLSSYCMGRLGGTKLLNAYALQTAWLSTLLALSFRNLHESLPSRSLLVAQ